MLPIVENVPAAVFKMPSVLATESTAYIVLPELAMASRFNVVGVNVGVLEMMAPVLGFNSKLMSASLTTLMPAAEASMPK